MEDSRFNLIRWFSLSASLVIIVISVITSLVLTTFLEEHLLRRDAVAMRDFVGKIAQHHDPSGYFANSYSGAGKVLNDFFVDIAHMPDVARINAFDPYGNIVWSSDADLIGKNFPNNHELEEALEGDLVYEKGRLSETAKSEHQAFHLDIDWFVENYIPIRDAEDKQIVGVVEIYRIPISLSESIQLGRRLVWICIPVGGIVLFASLYGVVRRGQHLIKNQQRRLVEQAKLAIIGELASSIAHSIRNPIASIRSSAELALEEQCNEYVAESLEDIILEVDRFDGWIRELLTFTSKAGKDDATANLDEVIVSSLNNYQSRATRLGVDIQFLPQSLPAVRGDERLLAQVLNSLLANALDAMPGGGKISIKAEVMPSIVKLAITDSGFGIPPDRLNSLFDPLVTHKNGGLGVGLALAKQITQRYKGDIKINSTVGEGTTVTIELPLAVAGE